MRLVRRQSFNLLIGGVPVGRQITDLLPNGTRRDPASPYWQPTFRLHPAQLRRLARRIDIGLGRTGSVGNDGSGEIFIAFSTANRIPRSTPRAGQSINVLVEGQFWTEGSPFDLFFDAIVEGSF